HTRAISSNAALTIDLEPGITLEVIPTSALAGPTNDPTPPLRSLVVRIVDNNVAVLVAPGLTASGSHALAADGWPLRADVLVVPFHGDRVALDSDAVAIVDPAIAVVPIDPRDRANHPDPAVLALLHDRQLLRTDLQGTISLQTDGTRLDVSPE